MTKPFLCTLSLCPLLVEQQAYNFLALPLFCCQHTLTSFSQLQLSLDCRQLKLCFSLPTKYFSYFYLLSAAFFSFKTSSRNSVLTHGSLLPYQRSAQWSGLVLYSEEVLLEGHQVFLWVLLAFRAVFYEWTELRPKDRKSVV